MTQVKEWTNERLNISLSKLMGRTEPTAVMVNYDMIAKYCEDPAASLKVQTAAIKANYIKYVSSLCDILGGESDEMSGELSPEAVADMLTASPRERAEAAYITLQGARDDNS